MFEQSDYAPVRLISPYTTWHGDQLHGRHVVTKPIWVLLDALFSRDPNTPMHTVPDGLDMQGQVKGQLSGWFRSSRGDWFAVVSYDISYADGRRAAVRVRDQLVPVHAVRPREGR